MKGKGGGRVTAKPRKACGDIGREKQALCILKFGSPPALWCLSYLFLLLSLKILLPRVLLNPAISQKAFCSSFATCFTCEQKSRCPFCADDVPPPSRLLPPQARQPYKGKRQHTLALHHCGWGPRLPSSCHRPPALPHKHHFPLPLQRPWM